MAALLAVVTAAACDDTSGGRGQRGAPPADGSLEAAPADDPPITSGSGGATGASGGATGSGGAKADAEPSNPIGDAATPHDSGVDASRPRDASSSSAGGTTGTASDAGADYTGPVGFEPNLIPPDASYDKAIASQTVNGVDFIDPSGALVNATIVVEKIDPTVLDPPLPDAELGYSFEPSGPLAAVVYVRIPLAASRRPGSNLEWWTLEPSAARWFLQSIGRVTADGVHSVFALSHLSSQAVIQSRLNITPLHAQNVSGSCEDFARATVKGVTDAEGTLHGGDCGYTKFLPTFAGLEQEDFMNAVAAGDLSPPFATTVSSTGTDPAHKFCARAYTFDVDLSATVEVSALDWTEGSKAKSECGRESRRLHEVVVSHEGKHVADANGVVESAQAALSRLDLTRCAASTDDAVSALATATQQALTSWFAGIASDWTRRQLALDSSGQDSCQIDCTKCDPCDPRTNGSDFSKCRYKGKGDWTATGYSSTTDVTWAYSNLNGALEVVLAPSGQIAVTSTPGGCTVAPTTHTIVASEGNLHLSYATDPPVYSGGGISTWPATLTCQGGGASTSLSSGWFWPEQNVKMPFTAPMPLTGNRSVSGVVASWSFALY